MEFHDSWQVAISKIERTASGCWEWAGARNLERYGLHSHRKKSVRAHRFFFEKANGYSADVIRHSCDNPPCCNPDHLLAGTSRDNTHDAMQRGRLPQGETHGCAKLTEANVVAILASIESGPQLAVRFGVDRGTINSIRRRESWRHVKQEAANETR